MEAVLLQAPPRRPSMADPPTAGEAIDLWVEWKASSGDWVPGVQENVRRMSRRWLQAFGDKPVAAVDELDLERHEMARASAGVAPSTMNQERAFLRSWCKYVRAHRWCKADWNPTVNWKRRLEVVRKKYVPIPADAEARIRQEAEGLQVGWVWRMITFAITTNLRRGAIMALKVGMVSSDADGSYLNAPAAIIKNKKALRIPLSPRAVDAMGPLEGRRPEESLFRAPQKKSQLSYWVKRVMHLAGLDPSCSFHDTRRTFVQRLSRERVPMNVIMKLGGWKRPNTMLEHYCDLAEEEQRRVLGLL
jgi:integrase